MSTTDRELPIPGGRSGRIGVLFAAIWLLFLFYPLQAGWQREDLRGWAGVLLTVVFGAAYLAMFAHLRSVRQRLLRPSWRPSYAPLMLAGLTVLALLVILLVGEPGTATLVYLATGSMMTLPSRWAFAFAATVAVGNEIATRAVPGWDGDGSLTFAIIAASFAMWGVTQMLARNAELLMAREENARLAVSEERNRLARDLHDILGHSLTVITVKAELAGRLLDVDPDRTRAELADLERLSRDALTDVRRAVAGYREVTLPGELARAGQALAAAGIEADVPNSTDDVPTEARELFAWTIREGVTNVIRHSHAGRCRIELAADRVEIRDDGRGPGAAVPGHGLTGLRERAAALGGAVVTEDLRPGYVLRVVLP